MFLKEKHKRKRNAWECEDRCQQRLYTDKEDTGSPTVSLKAHDALR